eukprot:1067252-Karenia_brevis.AAC.2
MEVDSRSTEEKIDSTLDSLTSRSKSRGREAPRARSKGGIPQLRYSLDEVLQGLQMSERSR